MIPRFLSEPRRATKPPVSTYEAHSKEDVEETNIETTKAVDAAKDVWERADLVKEDFQLEEAWPEALELMPQVVTAITLTH